MSQKNKLKLICFFMLLTQNLIAQNIIKHQVVKGESVSNIAEKYKVTPSEIYKLNPDILNGFDENTIILIPTKEVLSKNKDINIVKSEIKENEKRYHIVLSDETLYSLAKKFNTTVEALEIENPEIKDGIKVDQKLIIPVNNEVVLIPTKNISNALYDDKNFHIVQPKETLYGIAKKYNLTPKDLIDLNPEVSENLKEGFKLKINKNTNDKEIKNNTDVQNIKDAEVLHKIIEGETLYSISRKYNVNIQDILNKNTSLSENVKIDETIIIPLKSIEFNNKKNEIVKTQSDIHIVEKGETLYGISKKYKLTLDEILKLNPNSTENIQEGNELIIKNNSNNSKIENKDTDINKNIESQNNTVNDKQINGKTFKSLNNTLSKNFKEISILVPFNFESQDIKSVEFQNKLRKDVFLNLALDFYAGALIAIDSLKKTNINVKINFLDSNESKNSTMISLIPNRIKDSDVIIGPFYQKNVEEVAKLYPTIPVISPLSKESLKPLKNLYQSMPSSEYLKTKTFKYLLQKNEKVVAIIDKSKKETRSLIKNEFKDISLASINDKGNFNMDSLYIQLKKDKLNYLLIESSGLSSILSILNTVNTIKSKGYNTQLVILDMNKNYESDDVFPKLIKTDFIYPSISKPNEEKIGKKFNKIYKQRYNTNSSVYALRGFDVVFDTATRITQESDFETTANNFITSHIEYKFDYQKNPDGDGYVNNGIYFLKYNKEMKIVEIE